MQNQNSNSNGAVSPEVLEKLKKLLRLSESPVPAEAALALQRAQEIAIRHAIDISSIRIHDDPAKREKPVNESTVRKVTIHERYCAWIVQGHFGVQLIYGHDKRTIYWIGFASDILFAQFVWDFLQREFPRLWATFKASRGLGEGERRTYYHGVWMGLDAKLTEARAAAEAAKFADVRAEKGTDLALSIAANYAIVVRDKTALVKRATKEFFPHLKKSGKSSVNLRSADALQRGIADGRSINLSRPLPSSGSGSKQLQ